MHRLLDALLQRIVEVGDLTFIDGRGESHRYGDGSGIPVVVRATDEAVERRLILDPQLALGEAYMRGQLVMEKGRIYDFLELVLSNAQAHPPPRWTATVDAARYLVRRLYSMALTLLGLTVLVFLMLHLIPGTVVEQMIGADAVVSPAMVAELKRFFGLDQPWYVQYGRWIGQLAQGDLGTSWRTGKPVIALILERLPVTLELTLFSTAFALVLGVAAGVVSAVRRDRAVDHVTRVGTLLGLSVPVFWQGTMLILFFSLYLRWMPPVMWVDFWTDPRRNLVIMLLPALCLGTASAANIARTTRSCMLDVLGSEYIRTAAAKGLASRMVVLKHALRNALIPVVTVAGLQIGILLGGTVVVEEVFTLPGIGRLVLWSIYQRDYPLTQSTILFIAVLFMTINLAVDLLYGYLDPRIRYSR